MVVVHGSGLLVSEHEDRHGGGLEVLRLARVVPGVPRRHAGEGEPGAGPGTLLGLVETHAAPAALGGDGVLLPEPGDGAGRAGGSLDPAGEQQSGAGLHIHLRRPGDHRSALVDLQGDWV